MSEVIPFSIDVEQKDETWMIAFGFQTKKASQIANGEWVSFCTELALKVIPRTKCSIVATRPQVPKSLFDEVDLQTYETKSTVELIVDYKRVLSRYLEYFYCGELVLIRLVKQEDWVPVSGQTRKDWVANTDMKGFQNRRDRKCTIRFDITIQPVFTVSMFVDTAKLEDTKMESIMAEWSRALMESGLGYYCFRLSG